MTEPKARIRRAWSNVHQAAAATLQAAGDVDTIPKHVPGGLAHRLALLNRRRLLKAETADAYRQLEVDYLRLVIAFDHVPSKAEADQFVQQSEALADELRRVVSTHEYVINRLYGREGVERLHAIPDPMARFLAGSINVLVSDGTCATAEEAVAVVLGQASYVRMTDAELIAEVKKAKLWPVSQRRNQGYGRSADTGG